MGAVPFQLAMGAMQYKAQGAALVNIIKQLQTEMLSS
jgi:hypothetical protein